MVTSTSSRGTRILGGLALASIAALVAFGLFISPGDVAQGDQVRLLYLHAPSASVGYLAVFVAAAGSIMWLWKRSRWWDLVAASCAEIGALFIGITLLTGSLWGRHTWGSYWEWDPRVTTATLLFVLLLGYIAVRRLGGDPSARNTRSAVVALLAAADIPIVHKAVDWWRSLHQGRTVANPTDVRLEDLQLLSFAFGMAAFLFTFLWLVVHRFRVAWLEEQVEELWLDEAIGERRAEAEVAV